MTSLVERLLADEPAKAEYLLVKRGLYYRPARSGYTGIKAQAGRYFESDASPDCGVTAIHEASAPQFSDACYPDVAYAHLNATIEALCEVLNEALGRCGMSNMMRREIQAAITKAKS
jgi:hypothetical protein